jgi:hypothetical protein
MNDSAVADILADLQRRVQTLESKVAAIPDTQQIEERITERVQAKLPPPAESTFAPTFKDVAIPIPDLQTVVTGAKTSWLFFETLGEFKILFWTLFDRRYHTAWITRLVTIALLALIFTSQYWLPLTFDNIIGRTWEKLINLVFAALIFFMLSFEMRRYREWRKGRMTTP